MISFPSAPTVGQTYTYGTTTWVWNGYAWDTTATPPSYPDPTVTGLLLSGM